MKEKFARYGFQGFLDYEALEFMLFFAFKQGDTKQKARALLRRFGTLARTLDATVDEIAEVEGMGKASALTLKVFREVIEAYYKDIGKNKSIAITSLPFLVNYAKSMLGDKRNETLLVIFLNAKNEILDACLFSEGSVTKTSVFPRRLAETALKTNAVSVILVHNHPGGECAPSDADLQSTREIRASLTLIDVALVEHLIISEDDYFSFARNGYL